MADWPSLLVEVRRAAQKNRKAHLRANPAPLRGPQAYSKYEQAPLFPRRFVRMPITRPKRKLVDYRTSYRKGDQHDLQLTEKPTTIPTSEAQEGKLQLPIGAMVPRGRKTTREETRDGSPPPS
jgi:hypothetical protein